MADMSKEELFERVKEVIVEQLGVEPEKVVPEARFREDLEKFPENGWGLFGLAASLEAQGKTEEAREAAARFDEAWQWADVELEAARL